MTREAEEYLEEEPSFRNRRESLHRIVEAVKKEAEESACQEKSWLKERITTP